VEPVLVAQFMPRHGEISLIGILVSAAPGMVDPHRIIGRDWPIQKRPFRLTPVLRAQSLESSCLFPELENGPLLGRKIDLRFDLVERHDDNLEKSQYSSYLMTRRAAPARVRPKLLRGVCPGRALLSLRRQKAV